MDEPNGRLRVTVVLSGFDRNGATVQCLRVLEGWDVGPTEFELCVMQGGGELESDFRSLGIPVDVLDRAGRYDFSMLFRMARLLRKRKPDVVYTIKGTSAIWGRSAAILAGCPGVMVHERGFPLPFMGPFETWIDRTLTRKTSLTLANSNFTREIALRKLGMPSSKIEVLYNGFELDSGCQPEDPALENILQLRRTHSGPWVGFVGRLSSEKGCDLLLRSCSVLRQQKFPVFAVVCGSGPLIGPLEQLTHQLGLVDRVFFVGPTRNPVHVLRQFDVVVVPSIYESFCNIIPEAALAGIPVVAAESGGIPETAGVLGNVKLVTPTVPVEGTDEWRPMAGERRHTPHGRFPGFLVAEPAGIAEAIRSLLQDSGLKARLAESGRARVNRFSMAEHRREFERYLRRVATGC